MKGTRLAIIIAAAATAVALATPALADDYDSVFNNQLHTFGIYGPQDYNSWLAKITCERLARGIDSDAHKSAIFLQRNLPRGTTQGQSLQFLAAGIDHYCPEQMPVLYQAAA